MHEWTPLLQMEYKVALRRRLNTLGRAHSQTSRRLRVTCRLAPIVINDPAISNII